ncbi:hypothetical protein GPA10_40775 [Streptomyces sp. p1417]|uniref:Uncharacterized protein n=1 Tax=Streptomyces typhae TaxID=2681492 RepID=A0A6L6XBR1_9ACTN|nr:hypothetical protein [Streptomyces typhae]
MFEAAADEMAVPVPTTDTLYAAFLASLAELGTGGVAEVADTFSGLDQAEFPEVGACRRFAYRLALSFWYAGARSRPMTVGEAAAALYLSDTYRHHQVDAVTVRRAPLLVSRAIRQGATLVPVETLIRLGSAMAREFAAPVTAGRDWLYRQALPDWHRRRFCFDLMRADTCQPSPLIVRLDGGGYAVGATPPAGPDGTWRRALREQW